MDIEQVLGTFFGFLLDLFQTALPALILGGVAYFLFQKYMKYIQERDQHQALQTQVAIAPTPSVSNTDGISLSLKMQAYERLVLFCERISLQNLSLRVLNENMNAKDFKFAMMAAIQQEYDHNISQQVYVSENLWKIITFAKNDTVNVINLAAKSLPEDASGQDLHQALFTYLSNTPETALDKARSALSQEAATVL